MINFKSIPFVYRLGLKAKHKIWSDRTTKNIKLYLKQPGLKALHIGAGHNQIPNWFNTDYLARPNIHFLNTNIAFPFPSNSLDFVFSEHHIEHIHYKDAKKMLAEIFRVLKKDGVFRVCTPDLTKYLTSYFQEDALKNEAIKHVMDEWIRPGFYNAKNYSPAPGQENISFFINDIFLNYEHKFIYDNKTLIALLREVGFSKIYETEATKSSISQLDNIETHTGVIKQFTLAIEAVKE